MKLYIMLNFPALIFILHPVLVSAYCRTKLQEGASRTISCRPDQYLEFTCGTYYGTLWYCSGYQTTTTTLNTRCGYRSFCTIQASADWFGNPCWGSDKVLEYTHNCRDSWSPWRWSCPFDCRGDNVTRVRSCVHPRGCTEPATDTLSCLRLNCSRNGAWGKWTAWGECPESCTGQNVIRTRTCDSPSPLHGGAQCSGQSEESVNCLAHGCPRHGEWSAWTAWSECPEDCVGQLVQRNRTCDNPTVLNNGSYCHGNDTDTESCATIGCSVHGHWSGWSPWSECSNTCSDSIQQRNRSCDHPEPANNGTHCPGNSTQSRDCAISSCKEFVDEDDTSVYYLGGGVGGGIVLLIVTTVVTWQIKRAVQARRKVTLVKPFNPPTNEV